MWKQYLSSLRSRMSGLRRAFHRAAKPATTDLRTGRSNIDLARRKLLPKIGLGLLALFGGAATARAARRMVDKDFDLDIRVGDGSFKLADDTPRSEECTGSCPPSCVATCQESCGGTCNDSCEDTCRNTCPESCMGTCGGASCSPTSCGSTCGWDTCGCEPPPPE